MVESQVRDDVNDYYHDLIHLLLCDFVVAVVVVVAVAAVEKEFSTL
jgi:hypothetical protein